jgi:hypothetical protein
MLLAGDDDEFSERQQLLLRFNNNRYEAHRYLFPHRHKDASPEFHREILGLLYSPDPLVAFEAFRGAAKSTLLEEYILLSVLFRDFVYAIIVGNSWSNACQRLDPIKQELIGNDALIELFGDQVGTPWSQDEIGLACGAKIQCIGARQSLRGVKHNDERPDLAAIDDLEDEENISTEEARRKTKRWLNGTLLPSLNPKTRKVRMVGTPLHPQALIEEKVRDKRWASRRFPLKYYDPETGEEKSSWPDRFSLPFIREMEQSYMEGGDITEFNQEYMCLAEDVANKPFQASQIIVKQPPQVWMPTKIIIDPARTVNKKSARTGYSVHSWVGSKLIVHEAFGRFDTPEEIIDETFKLDERWNPVEIGVEKDGLELFLMQSYQAEMKKRNIVLPIRGLNAPRDKNKINFIKSLQPFYKAGEVEHAKDLPDLTNELVAFPSGRNDVLNTIAYALRMRAGRPVYEDFNVTHIADSLRPSPRHTMWLACSARASMTAAVAVQYIDGCLRIYGDWIVHAPPADAVPVIVPQVIMNGAGNSLKVIAPAEQFDTYNNNGLVAAFKRNKLPVSRGPEAARSEGKLTPWLQRQHKGIPVMLVADTSRWVVNGLAEGYARKLTASGTLMANPDDNEYKLIIEALEVFVSWFDISQTIDDSQLDVHYASTPDGRRYISSRPG